MILTPRQASELSRIADRHGDSFVWEHSRHRNRELVVQPGRRPVCTNHLLHDRPDATAIAPRSCIACASRCTARGHASRC